METNSAKNSTAKVQANNIEPNLNNPDFFLNRELSWLEFNHRVLEEGLDNSHPLLERLKFLCIVSSNLDEFFMVRVAGLKHKISSGRIDTASDNLSPSEILSRIHLRATQMVETQYKCLTEEILPGLLEHKIRFLAIGELNKNQLKFIDNYFRHQVFAVLTPLAVDPGHPFPQLANLSLNMAVLLKNKQKGSDSPIYFAVVQVPGVLERFIPIPSKDGFANYMPLGEIMKFYAHRLFPGYDIHDVSLFRVTRNADLSIDEEETDDLLTSIQAELRKRERGEAARLEIEANTSPNLIQTILRSLNLTDQDIYHIRGPINIRPLLFLYSLNELEHLCDEPFVPQPCKDIKRAHSIFEVIRQKDILLHHPYDSFESVTEFISLAAEDPNVLAIKLSLYRTSGDSPIIGALVRAVEKGKQVTALIELKARFDEENNITWARALEKAGVHVVYGFVGLKTHCKVMLVVRKEQNKLKRYVHLGTGNYNPTTAKLYTDLGLFTANDDFGSDISELFNLLTGYYQLPKWRKIMAAPIGLREQIIELIKKEIFFHKENGNGLIMAKMNALVDEEVIKALYEASQAGVKISLNIRGICCLRPGIPGVSENIQVISIVDRFLEHSRIFYFHHGGQEKVFIGSADWMPRNFIRRVEIIFPIDNVEAKKRIINEILKLTFSDNVKARILQSDGTYTRVSRNSRDKIIRSQRIFIDLSGAKKKSSSAKEYISSIGLPNIIKPRDYTQATEKLGIDPNTQQKMVKESK